MQRGNLVIKVISLILFAAMLCYVGFSLYDRYASGSGGQRTVLAVGQTLNESYAGEGLMVRTEQAIAGGGELCRTVAEDGGKVAAGRPVAALYDSAAALERSRELQSLTQQRQRLQTLLDYETASRNGENAAGVVSEGIFRLSAEVNSGAPEELDIICDEVRAMAISGSGESYSRRISDIDAEIASLQAAENSEVSYIYAPEAGVFSESTDGYEYLTPAAFDGMTSTELSSLVEGAAQAESVSGGAGRLITGLRWYFAINVPSEYAGRIYAGGSVTVSFPRWLEGEITARVERVGTAQHGSCIVVISADRELAALSGARVAAAELIFSSVSGIRVPREAARVDEERQAYVYILMGIQAERKDIAIIAETEEYYVVQYEPSDGSGLREGNEILVNYSGLYEGKVIE